MDINMNYYDMLGVERTATSAEIRKAYYQKIRIFSNETHPKEFQALTKAHKILSDPQLRAEYDRSANRDGEYERLMGSANEEMARGNYQRAIEKYDIVLQKYKKDTLARLNKGYALTHLGRTHEAHNISNHLRIEEPNNSEYLELTAFIYYKEENFQKSSELFEKLIAFHPEESTYHLRLSNCYFRMGKQHQANQVLQRKLNKGATIEDYPLLSELYFGLGNVGDQNASSKVLDQIIALPRNDNEIRAVIDLLIDDCVEITPEHLAFIPLVNAVRRLNNQNYSDVNEWLRNVSDYQTNASNQASTSRSETAATIDQTYHEDPAVRGSVLLSIIIGIVTSILFTPIVGIILGIVYYFYAESIKTFLSCLVYIIIAIVIIGFIFG